MKLKKTLAAATLAMAMTFGVQGQELANFGAKSSTYSTAIGLRGGYTSGLTVKQFVGGSTALEGILGFWNNGLSATLLIEKHVPAFSVSGLNWYYGAGGHAAFHGDSYYRRFHNDRVYYSAGSMGLGVDGIFGIEYKIPAIPFALSLDLKPFVEVNTRGGVGMAMDGALGIKVAF